MKKIYSILIFILTFNIFASTDIDKIVSEIKEEYKSIDFKRVKQDLKTDITKNLKYKKENFIQNNNLKIFISEKFENDIEIYEKYYLKDDNIKHISIEKTKYSFDKEKIKADKNKFEYYFNDKQELVRYVDSNNKIYDKEEIPANILEEEKKLKDNIDKTLKIMSSKDYILEAKKEFDKRNEEINTKLNEIKEEFDNFLKKF